MLPAAMIVRVRSIRRLSSGVIDSQEPNCWSLGTEVLPFRRIIPVPGEKPRLIYRYGFSNFLPIFTSGSWRQIHGTPKNDTMQKNPEGQRKADELQRSAGGRSKESRWTPEVRSMKPVKPEDQPAAQQQPAQKPAVVLCCANPKSNFRITRKTVVIAGNKKKNGRALH